MNHEEQREYDPYGERFSDPDQQLEGDEAPVGDRGTYPGGGSSQPRTCKSCGAELPAIRGRTKCRHCLEAGVELLDDDADPTLGSPVDWQFQQVQFAVVPGKTKYIAAARGATALKQAVDGTRAIDRVEPIYDFDEDVADVIADHWGGELPGVTRLDSTAGERLVTTARAAAGDEDEPARDVNGIPFFVDATGAAIDVDADLVAAAIEADPILDAADEPPVWLMPAWTLRRQGATPTGTVGTEIAAERECQRCGHFTGQVFVDLLEVPAPYQSAGIWECARCQARTFHRGEHTGVPRQELRNSRSTAARAVHAPDTHSWAGFETANGGDADWEREFPYELVEPEVRYR